MKPPLLCLILFFSFISFGQNIDNDSLKIDSLSKKATSYISKNKDSALYYFKKAENMSINTKNWTLLAKIYQTKGNLFYNLFQDNLAMEFYLKSDSVLTKNNIKNKTSFSNLINITRLLYFSTNVDIDTLTSRKIKNYLLTAIELAKNQNYSIEKAIGYSEYANYLSRFKKYKKAAVFLQKALTAIKNEDNNKIKSAIYWSLGANYLHLKKIDSAEYFYWKRIPLFIQSKQQKELALAYASLGGFYNKIERYKEAIYYQSKALILFNKIKPKEAGKILGTINGLATAYANNKQYKEAFYLVDKAYDLRDSLRDVQQNNLTLELEKKYQTQKKEHQITLLKTARELAKQQKINQRNLFIIGIGIVSFAGLFFFFLYRNRQKTTKKLEELAKLKSNLFANISHEFRTPLTLISGPIQQQLKKKQLSKIDRTNFEIIQQNTTRLLALVNQLLDVSKIESGTTKLNVVQHQLIPFINSLTEGFSFAATQKGIHLKTHFPKTTIKTWFDKDIVEKIITNLLSNALKYTPKNGTISCTSNLQNNNWIFEVKNTGKGIAKNEINKIFNRFYQLNKNAEGVGIGLALVKELALIHKGKITVESEPNKWTSFKVTIPINKNSFKTDEILNKTSISNNFKITDFSEVSNETTPFNNEISEENEQPILLVVDDNKEVLTYISNLFKNSYKILQAANGKEGIELALKYVPDIIISDVMMPIKDGIELCNTLKVDERTNHIPIILLTAKAGDENKITGIKTGADAYITKPFNNEFLQLKVTQLIAIRKKLQARYSQELILKPTDIAINSIDELFLERVQEVLDTNLVESSFHINEFCRAVGMSRMQLHRKLKALTGLSTTEFIRSQRLKLAAQLLKTSAINISQVGYSVGFNNHAYFSKCFKKIYNCTPSEYSKN
ncbi:ATP-binding protein [Lutibacter sp.]